MNTKHVWMMHDQLCKNRRELVIIPVATRQQKIAEANLSVALEICNTLENDLNNAKADNERLAREIECLEALRRVRLHRKCQLECCKENLK